MFGSSGPDCVSVVYSSLVMRGSQGPASALSRYALHNAVPESGHFRRLHDGVVAAKFPDQTHKNLRDRKEDSFR